LGGVSSTQAHDTNAFEMRALPYHSKLSSTTTPHNVWSERSNTETKKTIGGFGPFYIEKCSCEKAEVEMTTDIESCENTLTDIGENNESVLDPKEENNIITICGDFCKNQILERKREIMIEI
jgi:hypothetical protein